MDLKTWKLKTHSLPNKPECAFVCGKHSFPTDNPLRLKHMAVEANRIVYENDRGLVALPFKPGESIRASYPGWPQIPALISAGFVGENTLRVRCYAIGDAPCGFDMLIVHKTARSRCNPVNPSIPSQKATKVLPPVQSFKQKSSFFEQMARLRAETGSTNAFSFYRR